MNVEFGYGQENIDQAKIPSLGYTKGKMNQVKYYRALTWKFVRKDNNWYAYVTVDVDVQNVISLKNNGIISIDFNHGFLAVSDVDRYGNLVNSFQVPDMNETVKASHPLVLFIYFCATLRREAIFGFFSFWLEISLSG